MILTAITRKTEIARALRQFYAPFKTVSPVAHSLGHQGKSIPCKLYWHGDLKLWAVLENSASGNRSWNCFGTKDPSSGRTNLNIPCEINFPHEGINRKVAGVFALDPNGQIHVLHSGNFRGNKGSRARPFVIEHYQRLDRWVEVQWPEGKTTEMILVTQLDSPDLLQRVRDFVSVVESCKNDVQHAPDADDDGEMTGPLTFTPEFAGTRIPYTFGTIEARNRHEPIVSALHKALTKALPGPKYMIGNDRFRDLVVARDKKIVALFEVKPETSLAAIYTAIGQLSYHAVGLTPPPARILVAPEALSPECSAKLDQLGINVLHCRMARNPPEFPALRPLLARLKLLSS